MRYAVLAGAFLLVAGISLYVSTGADDSYISFWSSYSLAEFGKVVNYNGEPLEQGSNLAHVLLLAAVYKVIGVAPETSGYIISIIFGILCSITAFYYLRRLNPDIPSIGVLLIGSSPTLVYWSFSGLETSMTAFVYMLFVMECMRYIQNGGFKFKTVFITALFLLVRPESVVVGLCSFALFLAGRAAVGQKDGAAEQQSSRAAEQEKDIRKKALRLMILITAIFGVIAAARYAYFGSIMPHPVYAKIGAITLKRLTYGLWYLYQCWYRPYTIGIFVLLVIGAVSMLRDAANKNPNIHRLYALSFVVSYILFIVFSGGDWMEGNRFLVHILPIAAGLALYGLYALFGRGKRLSTAVYILIIIQAAGVSHIAETESMGGPIWAANLKAGGGGFNIFEKANRMHLRDIYMIKELDAIIGNIKTERPISIMSGQAGMIQYYITKRHMGRIRFIDRYGITTDDFTSCAEAAGIEKDSVGTHQDYEYYFKNKNKILSLCKTVEPDIIYDTCRLCTQSDPVISLLIFNGYNLAYLQNGSVKSGSVFFRGYPVRAGEFIAVKRGLPGMEAYKQRYTDWGL